ncbi:glycine betaine ABC transporter substrate-binding protein [Nocardioides sp. KR10-350]|uniref:glycine betaine ABC transporter substrate-binding protein n=1 Tax=Nocardioides cheoyonin TaxID=3156615 RepID=UPI0032B59713
MKRLKLGAAVAALALLGVAGCASGNSETGGGGDNAGGGKQITIGYINWDEDVAVTHLWQQVLEDKGYDVTIQQIADAGPTYVGLSKGDIDLFFDGWLPATHASYWKKYGSQLTDIKTWYDSAPLTIAVPNYVTDVKSLSDLKAHADEFDNTIIGIEPGAGLTATTKKMMPQYGLSDWTLKTSSTAGMLAELKKATDAKKPIVVTLWRPHWAYSAFPIRDLQDPKGAMGKPDQIHAIGTGSFADDFPEVDAMVKKFHMDDKQLGSLEETVLQEHKDDMETGVEEWLKANPDFESSLG